MLRQIWQKSPISIVAILFFQFQQAAIAQQNWEQIDRQLKTKIYQLNVGIKIKLQDKVYAYLVDLSPKYHLPVFAVTRVDKGFHIVSFGSAFPINTFKKDKTYFLTNSHIVNAGDNILNESKRFFAAMKLYAERTHGWSNEEQRFEHLCQTANLAVKKAMNEREKQIYQTTVDAIWDTYESNLSLKEDPKRQKFNYYLAKAQVKTQTACFLHPAGPKTKPSINVNLYKIATKKIEPDIAILNTNQNFPKLDFETMTASEGQEIQVIGYPIASNQIDNDADKYYAPTFNNGRITRLGAKLIQVDAQVTKGYSGGPVVSQQGKVLGMLVNRAVSSQNLGSIIIESELPGYAGAISVKSIKSFAPELFETK
jgi:DNA replication initiation complex subunit (GINS family)